MKIILVGNTNDIEHYSKFIQKDTAFEVLEESEEKPTTLSESHGIFKKVYKTRRIYRPKKSKKKNKLFY